METHRNERNLNRIGVSMTRKSLIILAAALVVALMGGALTGCGPQAAAPDQSATQEPAAEVATLTGPALYEFYTDW